MHGFMGFCGFRTEHPMPLVSLPECALERAASHLQQSRVQMGLCIGCIDAPGLFPAPTGSIFVKRKVISTPASSR